MTLNRKYQIKIQNIQKTLKACFSCCPLASMALKQECVPVCYRSKSHCPVYPSGKHFPVRSVLVPATMKGGQRTHKEEGSDGHCPWLTVLLYFTLSSLSVLASVYPRTHRSLWEEFSCTDSELSPPSCWKIQILKMLFGQPVTTLQN